MFVLSRKSIPVIEANLNTSNPRSHVLTTTMRNSLEFSGIKLGVAIARSTLSADIRNIDLMFEVLSSTIEVINSIDSGSRSIRLNERLLPCLKDFAKTSRLGKIAQGITYLFAQDYLNQQIIVDFTGFIRSNNPAASITGITPDFISQSSNNNRVMLFESKGGIDIRIKSKKAKLREAKSQLANGRSIISSQIPQLQVSNKYGICVNLTASNSQNNSELIFIDPEEPFTEAIRFDEICKYHYAPFFLLAGQFKAYEKLAKGEWISQDDLRINNTNEDEHTFVKLNSYSYLPIFWDIYGNGLHFSIRKDYLNYLMGRGQLPQTEQLPTEQDENYEAYFKDGTKVSIRELHVG